MFKKIFFIYAVGTMFFNSAIFAAEQETNQQIMLPITAGTVTLQNSDFDAQGNAVVPIKNFGPNSCPSLYVSPAAKYPWIMAYPSAYRVGHGVYNGVGSQVFVALTSNLPKPVTELSVTPQCDANGCNIVASFLYLYSIPSGPASLPAAKDTCDPESGFCFYGDGYLKVTYVAYCSTQPIQVDTGKHEPEQTKLK